VRSQRTAFGRANLRGFADPGRFGSVAIDEWRLLICEVGTYPDRHCRQNVVFSSTKSGNTIFPSTIKYQLSTNIHRDSTPRLTGQAKATPYGRSRLLTERNHAAL
jgi:hypothetical protein